MVLFPDTAPMSGGGVKQPEVALVAVLLPVRMNPRHDGNYTLAIRR